MKDPISETQTKPRVLIGAQIETPGPADYTLPLVSKVESKPPTFSLGSKWKDPEPKKSPGPNDFFPTSYHDGPITSIPISFKGRERGHLGPNSNCGPANYFPKIVPSHPNPPAFSITGPNKYAYVIKKPGPGDYSLPKEFGRNSDITKTRAAAFTMTASRPPINDLYSPGPAAYETKSQNQNGPSFSLLGRLNVQHKRKNSNHSTKPDDLIVGTDKFEKKPGPGQYNPIPQVTKSACYSFRTRHSKYEHFMHDKPAF